MVKTQRYILDNKHDFAVYRFYKQNRNPNRDLALGEFWKQFIHQQNDNLLRIDQVLASTLSVIHVDCQFREQGSVKRLILPLWQMEGTAVL